MSSRVRSEQEMTKLFAFLAILGLVSFAVAVVAGLRSATRQNRGLIARFFWIPLALLILIVAATLAQIAYHFARYP